MSGLAKRLPRNVRTVYTKLNGVANGEYISTSQITALVQFEMVSCYIDFYVVSDDVRRRNVVWQQATRCWTSSECLTVWSTDVIEMFDSISNKMLVIL